MFGRPTPGRRLAAGPLRFGPLAFLLLATTAAAVISVESAPRRSPVGTGIMSPWGTTRPFSTSATTTTSTPTGSPGAQAVAWADMVNGLNLAPDTVSCPSATLCVFAGAANQFAGQQQHAVSVSTGPFTPGRKVTGLLSYFPQPPNDDAFYGWWYVTCPSTTLCVISSPQGIYATGSPLSGHWVLEVAATSMVGFGAVSCPTVSFCAVAAGNEVFISTAPLDGSSAWSPTQVTQGTEGGVSAISCPSPRFCVAGGSAGFVGGWMEVSTDPGGGPNAWWGGPVAHPDEAQHSGEYSITDVSCPTMALCVANELEAPLLVSTNPAAGPSTWQPVTAPNTPYSVDPPPGVVSCDPNGACLMSGVGTFSVAASTSGPVFVGYPESEVSCVTTSMCISVDVATSDPFEVGGIRGTLQ